MAMFWSMLNLCQLLSGIVLIQAHMIKHDSTFTPNHVLRVSIQQVAQACYFRETAVVNGTAPGPEIRLKPGETSWVRVYNDMPDRNLTIHWHGLSQSVAPFSDGTPAASQWPIPPLHFFDYELHPELNESGTYFYHSHVGFQANSVSGPLIVEDHEDTGAPFDYDDEKIVFFSEFYRKTDTEITNGLLADPFVWSNEAQAILINGRSPAAAFQSAPPQTTTNCGPEVIQVEAGKTYRLRFIGGTALSTVSLGIEHHSNLTVIEADGAYTQPAAIDYVLVGSGQRFDMLLTAKTESELSQLGRKNFWIQIEPRYRPNDLVSYACLSYDGAGCGTALPLAKLLTLPSNSTDYLENSLAPLAPNGFPGPEEVTRRVTISASELRAGAKGQALYWALDNNTWSESVRQTPWLVDIYKNGQSAIPDLNVALSNESFVGAQDVYAAEVGEVLEIVWLNEPNGEFGGYDVHPFHAHGGHYYDLGSGPGEYDAVENDARIARQGYTPVLRDTTQLYKYTMDFTGAQPPYTAQGWRAWRIRVQTAGVWMLHCHTTQHIIMGMQTVWVMGNASQITAHGQNLNGYLEYGGDVYGNSTWDPWVEHFYDN